MSDHGIRKFERALRGMNSLDRYFLGVADKHHGHQEDFLEEMFVTGLDGVPLVDDENRVRWRSDSCEHASGEDDLPNDEDELDVPF